MKLSKDTVWKFRDEVRNEFYRFRWSHIAEDLDADADDEEDYSDPDPEVQAPL